MLSRIAHAGDSSTNQKLNIKNQYCHHNQQNDNCGDHCYGIIMVIIIVKHVVFASDAVHCEVHHRDAGTLSTGLRRLVKESKMEQSNHHLRGGRHAYNKGIDN